MHCRYNILYKTFGAAISSIEFTNIYYISIPINLIDIKHYVQLKYAYIYIEILLSLYKISLGFAKGSFGIINDSCLLSERSKSKLCTHSLTQQTI